MSRPVIPSNASASAVAAPTARPSTSSTTAHADVTTDVLVVGAGPTGLTLAAALRAQGIHCTVIDRQAEGANTSRAAVVHARTLEVLEPLGVTPELLRRGVPARRFTIRDRDRVLVPIAFDQLPTRYPFTLMVSQAQTEQVLLQRLLSLGGQVLRPRTLAGLAQHADHAVATLDDGSRISARYVVGADGMHSAVRQLAGIAFEGGSYGESFVLADVRLQGELPRDEVILYFSPAGMVVVAPLPDGVHRIVATVDAAPETPDVAFVQALLDSRGPERAPVRVTGLLWGSRFRVHHRIARRYRSGRVLIAGDAAHVHSPVALAGALVSALRGDESALDAYGRDRRPIAAKVVALADRLTRLATVAPAWRGTRNLLLSALAALPRLRRRLAWQLSGLVYR